jgi:hypothetical protein
VAGVVFAEVRARARALPRAVSSRRTNVLTRPTPPPVPNTQVECRTPGGQALCSTHGAGSGGWPTIKSFSAATPGGAPFPRTQQGSVCDEIASPGRLQAYAEGLVGSAAASGGAAAAEL